MQLLSIWVVVVACLAAAGLEEEGAPQNHWRMMPVSEVVLAPALCVLLSILVAAAYPAATPVPALGVVLSILVAAAYLAATALNNEEDAYLLLACACHWPCWLGVGGHRSRCRWSQEVAQG